jgi:hypothetical protein
MTGDKLGVQLGRLIFDATMESVGEAALLTGEDAAKTFIEYLTLLQFSASWRVALLFPDSCIDSLLDDIRSVGVDLLDDNGLGLTRDKIDRFQKERFGQYYAAIRDETSSPVGEVLVRVFFCFCASSADVPSDPSERGHPAEFEQAARTVCNCLAQLDQQIDVFVLGFMGNCQTDEESKSLPVRVDVHRRSDPRREMFLNLIAADLQKDIGDMTRLSRTIARGASIAGAGGLALVGYEAFMGDWLTTLTTGVLLLVAGGLANHHKSVRAARMRQKWTTRFSQLEASPFSAPISEMGEKRPQLHL